MLEDGTTEARSLAEAALEAEVKQLHLDAFPPGQSKLFTYLQQYSPVQYTIWLHRHDDQEPRPLLAAVEHGRQHSSLQPTPPASGAAIASQEAAGRPRTAQDHARAAPLVYGPAHVAAAVPLATLRPPHATGPSESPGATTAVLELTPALVNRRTGDGAQGSHA